MKIDTQEIILPLLKSKNIRLFIKRIDQNHDIVSGNKLYKLKYNFIEAKNQNAKIILTFGGAYSNHIAATAYFAKEHGFKSIGIIRGEQYSNLNPTIKFAKCQGMEIHYLNRSDYRLKENLFFLKKLHKKFGKFYLIPEGGTNNLAIKGTAEILDSNDIHDYICCPVGTGGTISGVINSVGQNQMVLGFPATKGDFGLKESILYWTGKVNYELISDYHFGGYAKINNQLIDFIKEFNLLQKVPLDAIYTGKMMFGVIDLLIKDQFPVNSSILAIHTGGLQGNIGINERFGLSLPINN